jgi:hypothetical protein
LIFLIILLLALLYITREVENDAMERHMRTRRCQVNVMVVKAGMTFRPDVGRRVWVGEGVKMLQWIGT